jgi:hypothetical protein
MRMEGGEEDEDGGYEIKGGEEDESRGTEEEGKK